VEKAEETGFCAGLVELADAKLVVAAATGFCTFAAPDTVVDEITLAAP
jgi:hypothetical protein